MTVSIGTSGWHYSQWRGIFYPPDLRPDGYLAYYSRVFQTVEINNTFYQLPSRDSVQTWVSATPEGFCFAVKASGYITHRKRLKEPETSLPQLMEILPLFGDKLGPVLFQLPPGLGVDLGRLAAFLDALPSDPLRSDRRFAFEFRHPSWFAQEVRDLLSSHGAAFCLYDRAGLVTPEWITAPFVYLRLHGAADYYQGSYTPEMLQAYAERIRNWAAAGLDVYCYFNNDAQGNAVFNARTLIQILSDLETIP